jgi:transposase InsO family protein
VRAVLPGCAPEFASLSNTGLRDDRSVQSTHADRIEGFLTLADARDKLEHWRQDYNRVRPHSAFGDSASEEFASAWQTTMTTSSDGLREGLS